MHMCAESGKIITRYDMDMDITLVIWVDIQEVIHDSPFLEHFFQSATFNGFFF